MTVVDGPPDWGGHVAPVVPQPAGAVDRYPGLELETGDVVIYDQERPTAWIRADNAVPSPEP